MSLIFYTFVPVFNNNPLKFNFLLMNHETIVGRWLSDPAVRAMVVTDLGKFPPCDINYNDVARISSHALGILIHSASIMSVIAPPCSAMVIDSAIITLQNVLKYVNEK